MKKYIILSLFLSVFLTMSSQTVEPIPYGNFDTWVTRDIKESALLGGKIKKCYAVGPEETIRGSKPYTNAGGSPWASSNVMAKIMGIVKVSNSVYPDLRAPGNRCAKLTTLIDRCKAVGIVNIDVLVAGTLFLGEMLEPISSTSNPYSKMEMGIPFTKRPKALRYDYKLEIPKNGEMTYCSGFGKKKTVLGTDMAEVLIILQRRWEDADGNIHAMRVGTGRERLMKSTDGWVNTHDCKVMYGDITKNPDYKSYMRLIPEEKSYYSRNSEGKMVPVVEEGWDSPDAVPTHLIVMFSSGSGEPYTGCVGMTLWVDNVGLVY